MKGIIVMVYVMAIIIMAIYIMVMGIHYAHKINAHNEYIKIYKNI